MMADIKEYVVRFDARFAGCWAIIRNNSLEAAIAQANRGKFDSKIVIDESLLSELVIQSVIEVG